VSGSTPSDRSAATQPVRPQPPTESVRKPSRPNSDLPGRLVTAAVLVPVACFVVIEGGLWLLGAIMTLVLLGQREFYRLIEDKGAHPLVGFGLLSAMALCVVQYLGTDYQANLLMTATLLVVLVAQLGKAAITEALASISGTFFGVFYVAWLLSHAILLRKFYIAVGQQYGDGAAAARTTRSTVCTRIRSGSTSRSRVRTPERASSSCRRRCATSRRSIATSRTTP